MVAVYWNALFILLNVYWVFRLMFEQKGDEQNTSVATSRLLQGMVNLFRTVWVRANG